MNAMQWMVGEIVNPRVAEPEPAPRMKAGAQNAVMGVLEDYDGLTEPRMCRMLGVEQRELRRHLRALVDSGRAYFDGRVWRAVE